MNSVGNSDIKNCLEELPTKTLPNKSILIKSKNNFQHFSQWKYNTCVK